MNKSKIAYGLVLSAMVLALLFTVKTNSVSASTNAGLASSTLTKKWTNFYIKSLSLPDGATFMVTYDNITENTITYNGMAQVTFYTNQGTYPFVVYKSFYKGTTYSPYPASGKLLAGYFLQVNFTH